MSSIETVPATDPVLGEKVHCIEVPSSHDIDRLRRTTLQALSPLLTKSRPVPRRHKTVRPRLLIQKMKANRPATMSQRTVGMQRNPSHLASPMHRHARLISHPAPSNPRPRLHPPISHRRRLLHPLRPRRLDLNRIQDQTRGRIRDRIRRLLLDRSHPVVPLVRRQDLQHRKAQALTRTPPVAKLARLLKPPPQLEVVLQVKIPDQRTQMEAEPLAPPLAQLQRRVVLDRVRLRRQHPPREVVPLVHHLDQHHHPEMRHPLRDLAHKPGPQLHKVQDQHLPLLAAHLVYLLNQLPQRGVELLVHLLNQPPLLEVVLRARLRGQHPPREVVPLVHHLDQHHHPEVRHPLRLLANKQDHPLHKVQEQHLPLQAVHLAHLLNQLPRLEVVLRARLRVQHPPLEAAHLLPLLNQPPRLEVVLLLPLQNQRRQLRSQALPRIHGQRRTLRSLIRVKRILKMN